MLNKHDCDGHTQKQQTAGFPSGKLERTGHILSDQTNRVERAPEGCSETHPQNTSSGYETPGINRSQRLWDGGGGGGEVVARVRVLEWAKFTQMSQSVHIVIYIFHRSGFSD